MFQRFNRLQPNSIKRAFKQFSNRAIILGIETSCDDTGCALIDTDGNILGEALNSQSNIHLKNGGIIPPLARDLHRENIESVVGKAVSLADVSFKDIDAIAVTNRPGLPMSLEIGLKYAKHLCRTHNKPLIPIHHMRAHALTVRMINKEVDFPFLVLLVSGGHCLITIANGVEDFALLGQSIDDSPGEALDKIARRLKLKNLPKYSQMSGGQAIEMSALEADNVDQFSFPSPMMKFRECNFSFTGLKNIVLCHILREEERHDVPPDGLIPDYRNICAGFQLAITRHLCHRIQRAIQFTILENLLPPDKRFLVVSGGVASNNFIRNALREVCDAFDFKLIAPPPKLCTDNGTMIAWNGVERWKSNLDIFTNFEHIGIESSCPIGADWSERVRNAYIKCKWVKIQRNAKTSYNKSEINS